MIKYFLISILASVVIACYEDKGNYDYREINEVRISGIDKQYKVGRWDTLAISTQVENSLVENSSLVYAWYLDHVKVATTKDLNYIVTEKPKTYNARFEVVDTTLDNVRFFQDFEVTVFSQYSEGIILLSEEEGNPYISFLNTIDNPTNEVTYDVFALENGKNLQGEALAIEQSDPYSYGGVLFVHTSKASHQLDPVLLKEIAVYNGNSCTEPNPDYNMTYCYFEGIVPEFGTAIGIDGRVYPKQARQDRFMAPSLKPIHVYGDEGQLVDYNLSPMALTSRNTVLVYDNLSGRFMYFSTSYSIPSFDENQYDVAQISETYIGLPWVGWGKNINGGTYGYSSLFYDANINKAALVRAHTYAGKMRGSDSLVILTEHHLAKNSKMVINSANNRLYYSDGANKIYMLNLSDPEFKFVSLDFNTDLPKDSKITMLKVSRDNLALYVGVESSRQEKHYGDVYKLDIKDGKILAYYKGMGGKPIDLIEKISVDYDV